MFYLGALSCGILFIYPAHITFGGTDWIDCVMEQYPLQRLSFTAFVFVPTLWFYIILFFMATLLNRNIITPSTYYMASTFGTGFIFMMAVYLQETYLINQASQKVGKLVDTKCVTVTLHLRWCCSVLPCQMEVYLPSWKIFWITRSEFNKL